MVVDYDPWLRHALSTVLRHVGATVHEASNGASALRKATEDPPHLIVLGSQVPELSTLELIAALRSDARTHPTAIVGVSESANVDAWLDFPCGPVDVLAAVVEALEVRRQALAATPIRSVSASVLGTVPLVESVAARSTSRTRKAGRSGNWRLSSGSETL